MPFYKTVSPGQLAQAISVSQGGKHVKNNTSSALPSGVPLAWADDGSVILGSASTTSSTDFAGISSETIQTDAYGLATKTGTARGVLMNLGAVAGQNVYLGSIPGTYSLTAPDDAEAGATILKLGRAEPADQTTTPVIDLFIEVEEIALI